MCDWSKKIDMDVEKGTVTYDSRIDYRSFV